MNEIHKIMKLVLKKLVNLRMWGGKHTEVKNLVKGLPNHFLSNRQGQKIFKKAIKELKNKEFLLSKPSTGEEHIFLNPRKVKDIQEFLRE